MTEPPVWKGPTAVSNDTSVRTMSSPQQASDTSAREADNGQPIIVRTPVKPAIGDAAAAIQARKIGSTFSGAGDFGPRISRFLRIDGLRLTDMPVIDRVSNQVCSPPYLLSQKIHC